MQQPYELFLILSENLRFVRVFLGNLLNLQAWSVKTKRHQKFKIFDICATNLPTRGIYYTYENVVHFPLEV